MDCNTQTAASLLHVCETTGVEATSKQLLSLWVAIYLVTSQLLAAVNCAAHEVRQPP